MKHIISLGAGVQSSTMALMAAHDEITPMPDCAIFADTGWESQPTYKWLEWLEQQLPFPLLRVQRLGLNLGDYALDVATNNVHRGSIPPWYVDRPFGMLPLQCSKEFKTRVVQRSIRESLGLEPRQRGPKEIVVSQWLGISLDEAHRMKPCEMKFVSNRWPLIEMRLTRSECLQWMEQKGFPLPPRSSCIFCPFKSDVEWRDLRDNSPDDWNKAIKFDRQIRSGYRGMIGEAFVHTQRVPLDQVELKNEHQPNMFGNECEGMCGV